MSDRHLEGLKVVELGTHIAVPRAARMMADWGADVIKIEPPKGDPWRLTGRAWQLPYEGEFNVLFQNDNTNKKGLCLDLKTEQGKAVLHRLLENADVFLSNTRPKPLKKLGLDYEDIKDKYPRLVYAHFSGYGDKGPHKDRPGFDVAAFWARGGALSEWTLAGNTPSKPTAGFGDATVGSAMLAGILAALYKRERTGRGEKLRISLYGAALWYNAAGVLYGQEQFGHKFPKARLEAYSPQTPFYKTGDGDWMQVSAPEWEKDHIGWLKALRLDHLIGDPRLSTLDECRKNLPWVIETFDKAFASLPTAAIMKKLAEADLVHERLAKPEDLHKDPQAWENGYLYEQTFTNGRKVIFPTNPVHFDGVERPEFNVAPILGRDSVDVLRAAGYSPEEIKAMIDSGAVVQA